MSHEACNGGGPWKSAQEVTHAVLNLTARGLSVSRLTDSQILELYRQVCKEDLARTLAPLDEEKINS